MLLAVLLARLWHKGIKAIYCGGAATQLSLTARRRALAERKTAGDTNYGDDQ